MYLNVFYIVFSLTVNKRVLHQLSSTSFHSSVRMSAPSGQSQHSQTSTPLLRRQLAVASPTTRRRLADNSPSPRRQPGAASPTLQFCE